MARKKASVMIEKQMFLLINLGRDIRNYTVRKWKMFKTIFPTVDIKVNSGQTVQCAEKLQNTRERHLLLYRPRLAWEIFKVHGSTVRKQAVLAQQAMNTSYTFSHFLA